MEIVQQIIRESVSGGFWNFVGHWILVGMALQVLSHITLSTLRIIRDIIKE